MSNINTATLMQSDAMRAATTRAERTIQTNAPGVSLSHSRDLAIELGHSFALAAITAAMQQGGTS